MFTNSKAYRSDGAYIGSTGKRTHTLPSVRSTSGESMARAFAFLSTALAPFGKAALGKAS